MEDFARDPTRVITQIHGHLNVTVPKDIHDFITRTQSDGHGGHGTIQNESKRDHLRQLVRDADEDFLGGQLLLAQNLYNCRH